jgi:hypothetical protein
LVKRYTVGHIQFHHGSYVLISLTEQIDGVVGQGSRQYRLPVRMVSTVRSTGTELVSTIHVFMSKHQVSVSVTLRLTHGGECVKNSNIPVMIVK